MPHWTDFLDPDGPDGAYLPWKKVEPRVGISRTTAWRLQKAGDFPSPYVVSPGRVAYREGEVEAWKASRGHRDAATVRPADLHRGRTAKPKPTEAPRSEPLSWSPPPLAQSDEAPAVQPDPPGPDTPPRATRRGSRLRGDHTGVDQMKFEF
jgi:predicted DNA-binding transcriptional regulator AlpA